MDAALADKVVLVTGASGGIGRALAEAFGHEGARLVLHGHRRREELEGWLADQSFAGRSSVVGGDLSDPATAEAAVDEAVSRFGRLDVTLANAGVWPPADVPLAEMAPERVRETVATNLLGATWTARAALAGLARTGPRDDGHGAAIVFTGSTAARFGERHHADYALSKAGLYGLVRTLQHEIVDIDPYGRVNLVEPGWTVTHMVRPALEAPGTIARVVATMPLRQLARARDVAAAALVLASPALSRHVTGQVLTVAGGMEGRLRWEAADVDEDLVRRRVRSTG